MMINMEEKTCVKVVLIGVGGYGKFYLREMEKRTQDPSVVLEGVCDVMPDVEKQYPFLLEHGIPVYREIEQFYEEHDADLAVISTPIPLHFEQVVKCLKHGSDVLIEKPLCSSVEEALEMAQIEKETGHFVAVGYQMNYSPVTRELKNRILNGEFGNPVVLKTIHGFKRGKAYYHRNNWAGKRTLHGHLVNDSPVNNSKAHQFQKFQRPFLFFLFRNCLFFFFHKKHRCHYIFPRSQIRKKISRIILPHKTNGTSLIFNQFVFRHLKKIFSIHIQFTR